MEENDQFQISDYYYTIRGILKVFVLISSLFAIDMIYTIFFSERYYLVKVNYILVILFILSLIAIFIINIHLNDLLIYEVKHKLLIRIVWGIVLVLLVFNSISYIKGFNLITRSHYEYTKIYGKYDKGDQLMSSFADYIVIVFEYIYLRFVIRYFPAVFNLKRKHTN